MKISVLQENLVLGLLRVSHCVSTKPQLPILGNVLLKTEKGRLRLSATNLEIGINTWVGVRIEKEGAITVPARVLTDFVSSLSAGKMGIETEGAVLKISSASFEARFNGTGVEEFPSLTIEGVERIKGLSEEAFLKIVDRVCFAAAIDEGRPVLTGVLLTQEGEKISAVATDGYRLSLVTLKGGGEKEGARRELVVPARTLFEVSRIIRGEEGEERGEIGMFLAEKNNQLVFRKGDVEVVSRLIEGRFPEFEKIIPREGETKVVWDKEELSRAIKTASIFARDSANIVRIKIGKKECVISANAEQVGENTSRVSGKVEGKEVEAAFNYKYLLDFMNSFEGEEVFFETGGALSPGVFKGGEDYLHIIMPVRAQG
jgi:DNA polymerase-3 subunit beta